MLMKSIPRFISVALVTSFLFSFITPSVYASDFKEYDYWTYWYVEQSTGVTAEDVTSTDAGISNGEYIASNGGGSRQDAYDWIKDKYDNATNATANGIEYYYNAVDDIYNKSVDYAVQGYYTSENALRKTVDTAGKTVYNVSSSDFWSGFYNQMYNGGGYNDIYKEVGGNNSWTGNNSSGTVSVSYMFLGGYSPNNTAVPSYGSVSVLNGTQDCIVTEQNPSDEWYGGHCVFRVSVNGQSGYYLGRDNWGWTESRNVSYQYENNVVIVSGECYDDGTPVGSGRFWSYRIIFDSNFTSGSTGSVPVLQPSQMGFIIDPLTGDRIPVYTDTTKNPFIINPDGTVDYNGTTYPIYVDPEEISDDGWLWILDYINKEDNTKPSQNPYGKPWNTQNDGTVLGGLFNGLIEDISSLFDKISSTISDLISKLLNIITDALKKFLIALVGDMEGYSDLFESSATSHFDIVEELYDLLLQCMGVNS